ncbi:MAG: DUF1553 domain-containing protein [Gemmataceae bacterium]|jgi:hypothetical protein|nr:DUF1553 domain-containing protein [Gemmataceae bacterium]
MRQFLSSWTILTIAFLLLGTHRTTLANDFFEKKIRPILIEHCFQCHSAEAEKNKKLKGGLLLDSHEGVTKGGDSGPVIVTKNPAESLLLKSLKYQDDLKMPPKKKLPESVIADFEKWIAQGLPGLPKAGAVKKNSAMTLEEGRNFWAYKPIQNPPVPMVQSPWAKTDLDRFILAQLESKKLSPAPVADKATLIRRVYFDLLGYPPTLAQVDAFVNDPSPQAYEKLIDYLLASPQFGERWGRHWLDIARYAESVTLRGFIFKEAWRYRDYVIDTFNQDVPFDRFIREQIAGDLLEAKDLAQKQRSLIATSFLVLGNTNFEEQDKKQLRMDFVDEQLDVITKGFLAQTVTCARCHDHKFDPIPTKDYYALAGILRNTKTMEHANVSNWIEVPLPVEPEQEALLKKHEAEIARLQDLIAAEKKQVDPKTLGVILVKDVKGIVLDDTQAKKVGEWMHSTSVKVYIGEGYLHDKNEGKGEKTLTFQPDSIPAGKYEVRLAYSAGTNRADSVPVTIASADGEKTVHVNMKQNPPILGRFVSLGEHRFEKDGQCYVVISNEGTNGHVIADAVVFLPLDKPQDKIVENKPNADRLKLLETELKSLIDKGPKRPKTMGVLEEKVIEEAKIHIRGNVHNQGELVPRNFLQVTQPKPVSFPKNQSGRKELADWIASADNPLTARVYVNRVWYWLFGEGLVRTVDNFGTTGEAPSHPELLDYLASQFLQQGWSTKKLIRQIMLSQTYQQSTTGNEATLKADPENRLFGRANRRRLDAECIRDAMLVISGKLDPTRGGPTFPENLSSDYGHKTSSLRRSIYLPMFRNALPDTLEVFDLADPSMVTGKRNVTTVAQQALYLMNHPFPLQQAQATAEKLLVENYPNEDARIIAAYRLILGRLPNEKERGLAQKFLQGKEAKPAWTSLVHVLFATPDFRYVN